MHSLTNPVSRTWKMTNYISPLQWFVSPINKINKQSIFRVHNTAWCKKRKEMKFPVIQCSSSRCIIERQEELATVSLPLINLWICSLTITMRVFRWPKKSCLSHTLEFWTFLIQKEALLCEEYPRMTCFSWQLLGNSWPVNQRSRAKHARVKSMDYWHGWKQGQANLCLLKCVTVWEVKRSSHSEDKCEPRMDRDLIWKHLQMIF